jgi:hypothetical protein
MSEQNPIHPNAPRTGAPHAARKLSCEEWEAMLVDFLDGTLPSADAPSFHAHQGACAACTEMFAHSGQGREWLDFLRPEPPVPAALITKILAQTSGAEGASVSAGDLAPAATAVIPIAPALPFWQRTGFAMAGRRVAQPRLMMTAAMAFFSITLTLNMAGVRLSAVRLADLNPATMSSNLNKQYHQVTGRVVHYYDNLRFVYGMEARVQEFRHDSDLDTSAPSDKPSQSAPATTPKDGHKSGGKSQLPSTSDQTHAMLWGEKVEARLETPAGESNAFLNQHQAPSAQDSEGSIENTDSSAADRAERGIA